MALSANVLDALKSVSRVRDPFELIDGGHLWIRTREGLKQFTPETMKPAQKRLYKRIKELYYAGKPIRIRILKARQMGFSTLIQAILYSFAVTNEYWNALVLSYRAKSATWLFGMQKLFQEQIILRKSYDLPSLIISNEKKMEWRGTHSIISVDTEGSPNVALTETRNASLLTEKAFYDDSIILMQALLPSIPFKPGTMMFEETTANGTGNQFYIDWKSGEKGEGDFENMFFAWWEDPDYRMTAAEAGVLHNPTADTESYRLRYNLDDDQYRWYLKTLFGDSFRGDMEAMAEKYPASADEAFRTAGGLVFQDLVPLVNPLLNKDSTVLRKGTLGRIAQINGGYAFQSGAGAVEVFVRPIPGKRYCAYSDTGEGLKNLDAIMIQEGEAIQTTHSTTIIRDGDTWELVALMECRYPPDVFADKSEALCRYYNNAIWGVEIPGPGFAVISRMIGRYDNLYRSEWVDPDKQYRKSTEYGFRNDMKSKPVLEADWAAMIREKPELIGSMRIAGQMLTYIIDPKTAKHRPKPQCFSDLLLADMGCVQMLKSQKGRSKAFEKKLKDYRRRNEQNDEERWRPLG